MTKTLRIAMVGQKGIPARFGGVETHVDNVATRLTARGHEVWTYCRSRFRPDRLGVPLPDDYRVIGGEHWYRGVRLVYRPSVNTKHLDAATHTFLCAVESGALHKFDIVHFHGIGPAAFAPVTKLFGKKVVSTFHALDWRQVKWGPSASRFLKRGESETEGALRLPELRLRLAQVGGPLSGLRYLEQSRRGGRLSATPVGGHRHVAAAGARRHHPEGRPPDQLRLR